jgi:WD40 repeat protein
MPSENTLTEIYEIATGERVFELPLASEIFWSPNGRYLMLQYFQTDVSIYDADGQLIRVFSEIDYGRWLMGGERFALWDASLKVVWVYETETQTVLFTLENVTRPVWSPDEQLLLTVSEDETTLHDGMTGEMIKTFPIGAGSPVAWRADLQQWISITRDAYIVWNRLASAPLFSLNRADRGDRDRSTHPYFSADGQTIWWSSADGLIQYDALTGEIIARHGPDKRHWIDPNWLVEDETGSRLEDPQGAVLIEFHPLDQVAIHGTRLISYGFRGTASVWDGITGALLLTLPHHTPSLVGPTVYHPPILSPSGRYLLSWQSPDRFVPPMSGFAGRVQMPFDSQPEAPLYAEPESESEVIAQIGESSVQILEAGPEAWWRIETSDGIIGWLNDLSRSELYSILDLETKMTLWAVPSS